MITFNKWVLLSLILFSATCVSAQTAPPGYTVTKNLIYAKPKHHELKLDLYIPEHKNPLLVAWIHGGAWHSGSRENPPLLPATAGIAIASVDYRLSVQAPFPAAIHDIKAAIRYLRSQAKKHGYRSRNIGIWGSSAGGHLAALTGVTNGNVELEGKLGKHLKSSSDIQAIVDFYGPTNFLTILKQSTPHGLSVRAPALALLLGAPLSKAQNLATLASPVFHVEKTDPPIMIVHGNQDVQVPINQSLELAEAYKAHDITSTLVVVPKAGHSSKVYFQQAQMQQVETFFKQHLE